MLDRVILRCSSSWVVASRRYATTRRPAVSRLDRTLYNFKSHVMSSGHVSHSLFTQLLRLVEKTPPALRSNTELAKHLLGACSRRYVDLTPRQRQACLNYLFNEILDPKNNKLDSIHYDSYMTSTLENRARFDPFLLSELMRRDGVGHQTSINKAILEQLCNQCDIKVALNYLNKIMTEKNEQIRLSTADGPCIELNDLDKMVNRVRLRNEISVGMLNPFLSYYLNERGDLDKAFQVLGWLDRLDLQPNSSTYSTLIAGFFTKIDRMDESLKLYTKVSDVIEFSDLMDIYAKLGIYVKQSGKKRDLELVRQIESDLRSKHDKSFNMVDCRIRVIDLIMHLSEEKRHMDVAYEYIVNRFYSREMAESDPVMLDLLKLMVNVPNYFLKSIVENSKNKYELEQLLVKYSIESDIQLKQVLYYALFKSEHDHDLIFHLFDKLEAKNQPIKSSYFYPMFARQAQRLSKLQLDIDSSRDSQDPFTRLVYRIGEKYETRMPKFNYAEVLEFFFRSGDESRNISYQNFAKLFLQAIGHNAQKLFQACSSRALDLYLSSHRGGDMEQVFEDILILIQLLNIRRFDEELIQKIDKCLNKGLERRVDIGESLVLTVCSINEKMRRPDETKIDVLERLNARLLEHLKEKYDSDKSDQSYRLLQHLNDSLFDIEPQVVEETVKEKVNELVKSLENNLKTKQAKSTNDYSLQRHIILKLIHRDNRDFTATRLQQIEHHLSTLPESEYTPMLCQNLMNFYAKYTRRLDLAEMYLRKFIRIAEEKRGTFEIDRHLLLFYLERAFKMSSLSMSQIIELLGSTALTWSTQRQMNSELEKLFDQKVYSFLESDVFNRAEPDQFMKLVERMIESGMIKPNANLTGLVILKLSSSSSNQLVEYFKRSIVNYKIGSLEPVVLGAINKSDYENLVRFMYEHLNKELVDSFRHTAYVMDRRYSNANKILNKRVNWQTVSRLADQLDFYITSENKKVSRAASRHAMKLLGFLTYDPARLDPNSKSILSRLNILKPNIK